MNRSAIRDLVLTAGIGLLLGANTAFAYLTVGQLRDHLSHDLTELLRTVVLIAAVAVVMAVVLVVRARGANIDASATDVSTIRSYSRAAASRPPARRLAR